MKVPFSPAEVASYLEDSEVAALSLVAVAAVREGSLAPFGLAAAGDGAGRKAAFAASVHGLAPRLASLRDAEALPSELRAHLGEDAARCEARGERIVQLLEAIRSILSEAGIVALPLKGAALVLRGTLAAGQRPMADIDLLLADGGQVAAAGHLLASRLGYRTLWNTPRHLVLAEKAERVLLPACEHPGNPLRIELHRSFRLEVLGAILDATPFLRTKLEERRGWQVPNPDALLLHLLFHAAEDFAAKGLRGIQAVDFLLLARESGPLRLPEPPRRGAGPLLYAADAIERLFPGTFASRDLALLAARVPPHLRARAAALPVLRHSRPVSGWTATSLSLIDGALGKTRFLARTLVPTFGEVKANVAPEAEGLALVLVWLRVFSGRAVSALRRFLVR